MGLSASRALFLAAFVGAVYVSLRPHARVERALDLALSPARALIELGAPLSWLRWSSIRAAERALSEREEVEYSARLEFDEAERRAALPASPQLRDSRRFVHATVVGRRADHFDHIVIEPDGRDMSGLELGLPVTSGDVFVGRIVDFDASQPGRAFVELVTARDFAVGAVLDTGTDGGAEPIHFVAGGVVTEQRGRAPAELAIAVHNPSRRELPGALARVDESFSVLEHFAPQARGFELGWLETRRAGEWSLRPRLDYRGGLFQVVVVCPADVARASDGEVADALFDGGWRQARVLSRGEPTALREGLKLAVGTWNEANVGAAVVAGARLVGVVAHVGPLTSDVRTLGDRGLALPVVARVDGIERPVALGVLVALGRASSSTLRLRWDAVVPLDDDEHAPPRRARLFTTSGTPFVPRGLLIGDTELPSGPGPHELVVRQELDGLDVRSLWVRTRNVVEQAP